jgi:hypothetical protein
MAQAVPAENPSIREASFSGVGGMPLTGRSEEAASWVVKVYSPKMNLWRNVWGLRVRFNSRGLPRR